MKKLLLLFLPVLILAQSYRFKKVAGGFPISGYSGPTLLFDSNNDGHQDLTFPVIRDWQIWEYVSPNRFELAYTGMGHWTEKWAIGDIDQDGLWDRLETGPDSLENDTNLILTYESENPYSYPININWVYKIRSSEHTSWDAYYPGDLDGDGQREIFFTRSDTFLGLTIMENRGNNNNVTVWRGGYPIGPDGGPAKAFGDFDQDGRMEFVQATASWHNKVSVYENTGNDQYQLIFVDTITLPNGHFDAFSGNDVNQNGKPEFFINFFVLFGIRFYLYMWEAVGDNRYQRVCIDSTLSSYFEGGFLRSICADIDADRVEEIIQAAGTTIAVYKFINGEFRRISLIYFGKPNCCLNSFDLNGNGYNEIIASGLISGSLQRSTDIYELEVVWLLRPNRNETFRAGTQELIRWRIFQPPRCDSLSLFYSIDNGRNYYPIATGLPGTDTTYLWTVPYVRSDSCKVKVIAYGPGWQDDESDGVFRITAVGMEEGYGQKPPGRFEIYP
ncbi:MAG: VCBS repeat-containing protein, partial [candidate division WOR-3 bacterium]